MTAVELIQCDWTEDLARGGKGQVLKTSANLSMIVERHPALVGAVARNMITHKVDVLRDLPWRPASDGPLSDVDASDANVWLQGAIGQSWDLKALRGALGIAAEKNKIDPLGDYLRGLNWDGTSRIERWLIRYLGGADTPYLRAVGKCWLTAAVARALRPGCKVDTSLVLEGPQGSGKSTALSILGGDYFTDATMDTQSKDSAMIVSASWIIELGEAEILERRTAAQVKAWISRRFDHYRRPYAAAEEKVPRRCVFGGSTNQTDYLNDETGNRRWWPVKVGRIDLEALRRDRDQLFAEAVMFFERGAKWHLEGDLATVAGREADARRAVSTWEEKLRDWLPGREEHGVSSKEVLTEAIGKELYQITRSDEMRAASVLKLLKWESHPTGTARLSRWFGPGVKPPGVKR